MQHKQLQHSPKNENQPKHLIPRLRCYTVPVTLQLINTMVFFQRKN